MPRYIEVQTALNIIDKYAKTVTENEKVIVDAVRDIVEIITPAADIVPKSEVEELRSKITELKKDRYQVLPDGRVELIPRTDIEKIKAKVVREIFEEVEKIIDEKYNRFVFKDQPYDSDEEIDAIINYSDSVSDAIVELKKKYMDGKT